MIRRHVLSALALVAMGFMVAAPAEAGGTSGAVGVKKNATVLVKNTSTSPWYVLVVPESLLTSTKFGTFGTVGWAKKLGAALVNPGSTLAYPVPAGPGLIAAVDPSYVSANPSTPIVAGTEGSYTVAKGKTVTKIIKAGPVIE